MTPAGTTFGGTATYSCSAGYSLVGETTRTCQASGVWSGSAPTCAPVDCGGLPNPGNGTVATPAGTEFGATATYSCSSGFTLVGTDTRTCEASGRWSGAAPTCSEVDCGSLAAPGNGTVNTPSGTGRGATATYACTSGYTLSGAATRTCGDTGTWTGTAPTCTAVDCGVLTNPTNGAVQTASGTAFGASATYSCSAGYSLVGEAGRTCLATGLWSGVAATCSPVDCGTPPTVTNGSRTFTTTVYQSTANYSCATGFVRAGAASITCQATGAWSTPPACNDINECTVGGVCTGVANTCTNTAGSWSCGCSAGYTGSAVAAGNAVCVGVLGSACSADNNCPAGSWCPTSTLPELRRCSPRVFGGQAHQMDFMFVPAGTFEQGTTGATGEERPYTATITRNYFVSRTEVTQGQWRAASGAVNPSCFQSTTGTSCTTSNANNSGPVEQVDWWSAVRYANWLSSQNGLSECYALSGCSESSSTGWYDGDHDTECTDATFVGQSCTGYRLLTEAEWERAARGGTTSTYYWGESTETATMGQYGWYNFNSDSRTQSVGLKLANAYGLVDISGNVLEWVWDLYASAYPSGSSTNYVGASSGSVRVLRGGSFGFGASNARTAYRGDFGPSNRFSDDGFRLARTVPTVSGLSCPVLDVPANGRLAVSSFFAGATAVYGCDAAYAVEGAATRTCQSDGTWSGVAPSCVRIPSLGQVCTTDTQCESNEWCPTNTLSELRRCSPRLFGGQAHQMDFMFVPAGTFEQGTPGATDDERPYTATITRNYFVSRTEVTQGQWRAASDSVNPSCFQSTTGTSCTTTNANNTGPVENVDWWSAVAYANWLSSQNGLPTCYTLSGCSENSSTGWYDGDFDTGCTAATFVGQSCTGYRLLTESEWERAARGGTTTTHYWGESTDLATMGQYAWYALNSGARSQTVGQKLANPYGLVDMIGNVAEWVWDRYSDSYPSGTATDYVGPSSGTSRLDSGSTYFDDARARAAARGYNSPSNRYLARGFRVARTVPVVSGVSCPALNVPANGRLAVSSFFPGATAAYVCDPAYVVEGTATRTCQSDGTWSGVAPTCLPLLSLGQACLADTQCGTNGWCPTGTLPELRRCSPRLFGGQAHQMDFMFVPAGTFEQGSPGTTGEERPYTSTISRNYFVSRTEVTQGQWRAASGTTNPSCFQSTTGTSCTTSNANNTGPVENIDWWSAVRYANWLSTQNSLTACYTLTGCTESSSTGWYDGDHDAGCTGATFVGQSCTGYRLLTESEWERAARGGTTSTYYWGESTVAATVGQYAWYTSNSGGRTQLVGQKGANAYGLVDTSGSVAEWVWDWVYSGSAWLRYPSLDATDYLGGVTGSFRGLRGGSWPYSASDLRSANRFGVSNPAGRDSNLGLRLARTVP